MTKDGKQYRPLRYESIIKERYLISKRLNTSYTDTANINPTERGYLVKWILEEIEAEKTAIEQQKAEIKKHARKHRK